MAVPLTGYRTVRLLRASGHARVYEAVREADEQAVIAKVFDIGATDDVEARVEHEFAMIEALEIEGVVKALALHRVGDQLLLLLERVAGIDLAAFAGGQPLEIDRFLAIAIQLSEILGRVHERRIIHRDIKPTNILIEPDSGRVYLADFGISVLLENERRFIYDPAVLQGTLPYISPEQSGRTGRAVDFRSDLYSLGVTFYELLTGRRPFDYAAPLELIHAHLARTPEPPQRLRPDLPDGLARLVLKLLEKAPEHRYQTAAGLAVDLRKLRQLHELGDSGFGFVLGREDRPRNLQLPHQLYGREFERHELVDELERVIRGGVGRVMLLSGPPGIGKSSLLADFEGVVAGFGGYLARGQFEAHRELPYSGFVSALATLVEQLLTESEERLRHRRNQLELALGGVGRVICELVPKLELVLGEQPALAELEPPEARNRVHLALSRFLMSFCAGDQPLVLVLDNLQWADASSLALLRALIDGGRPGALLILGGFRDGEVGPSHPLRVLIEHLAEQHRLRLTRLLPLSQDAVEALLADALARPAAEVRPLATAVARKTANNPLFVRQFLTDLATRRLLRPSPHGWIWDDEGIEATPILDNVLEVMTGKLAGLGDDARVLLAEAACVGASFDLASLEVVCRRPRAELTPALYELVDAGLLTHLGHALRFAHERIHQAAYQLLDPPRRRALHWRLGRHRLETLGDALDEQLFEVVDHLDAGAEDLDDDARLELAALDLRAGARALGTAAYDPALRYLEHGLALVADLRDAVATRGEAADHYDLVVDLHFARAQILALSNRREQAKLAFDELLDWRLDLARYGRVAARRIRLLALDDRPTEAVELARVALARCGFPLPRSPGTPRMLAVLVRAWLSVRGLDLEALMTMPACRDERAAAAMELLTAAKTAAYVVDPKLFVLMLGVHIQLFRRHGFHPSTPLAMAQLAMGVGSGLRRVEDAIQLCDRGLALCDRVPLSPARARVESAAYLFVWHLGRPFAEPLARIDDAYQRALEAGDFEYAGYMGALGISMHLDVGTHLRVVERLSRRLEEDLGRWGSGEMLLVAWMIRCFATVLAGASEDPDEDQTEVLAAIDPERVRERGGSRISIYASIANRALVQLLANEVDDALRLCLRIIDDVEQVMLGTWTVPRTALTTVVAAALALESGRSQPPAVDRAMRKGARIIARWTKDCPANYAHYHDLARGLRASLRGRPHRAMALLEQARRSAGQQGCRWVEGLAAERLAAVAEGLQLQAFAEGARLRAWEAYEAWGAGARLDVLRGAYPEQFAEPGAAVSASSGRYDRTGSGRYEHTPLRSSATSAAALDFESVLGSVGLISEALQLDEVVGRVLEAALTNAGADRGVLVLERDGVLGIVARAGVDGQREFFARPVPLTAAETLAPTALIHFVLRTEQDLVIDDARTDPRFSGDPYVSRHGVLSLLGLPIIKGKRPLGALVLENRLSAYCFTPERLEALRLIAGQAASALENARLYAALRRSEARWRSLVDGAPDVIALLNERGEVEFINRANLLTGDGEQRGRLLERMLSPSSAQHWREALRQVLRQGDERALELEVVRPGHANRWFAARLAPIEIDARDEPGGDDQAEHPRPRRNAIAVATDITERKAAELEKHNLEAQLRQQQRLESLGTLASGVAHEINNPVQGILNYAELINDNAEDVATVREFSHEITIESQRVATIVRNLLAFSRQEREQRMEEIGADELISATLSLIHAVMRKDQIEIGVEVEANLPPLRCRVQQIQQILMNLVTNARDALNEAYPDYDPRKRIVLRGSRTPGVPASVRLSVEDQGPGIPPEVLPRIFDPFFTTKGRDQGTGLGLAVSHGIAMEHGGELSVETRLGEGTRFHLDLPAA